MNLASLLAILKPLAEIANNLLDPDKAAARAHLKADKKVSTLEQQLATAEAELQKAKAYVKAHHEDWNGAVRLGNADTSVRKLRWAIAYAKTKAT